MSDIIQGFEPVFDANSALLILGSFPSVKSRQTDFYYGNRQNKFWKMLFGFFGEPLSEEVAAKRAFVLRRGVALWDIVTSCRIKGSSDASIKDYTVADVPALLNASRIRLILLNGTTAYKIFVKNFPDCPVPFRLMPSTSPANVRYDEKVWHAALHEVFSTEKEDLINDAKSEQRADGREDQKNV